ncbi:hypothetical protein BD413DRAFT_314851 [Trametes elegans]|nr:hypothetical protein BD413DRAFT_314851 [Trametes elegans]
MRLSFSIGCTCAPTNTVEDIWLDVDLDTYPTPHISASGKAQYTERQCTHSHLTRDITKLRFERGPTLIECRVAPWCGYPMRSSGIASCQYLVDVSITESMHDQGGGSVPIRTSYDMPAYAGYPDPNYTTPPSMVGPQSHVPHPMPRYRTPPAFHTPVVTFGGLEERTITPHSQVYPSYSPLLYGSDTHQVVSPPYSPYTALPGPVNTYPSSPPRPTGPPYLNPSGARRPSYSAGSIPPRNPYANSTYSHPLTSPRQAGSSHPPNRSPFPIPGTNGGLDLHGARGEGWTYNPLLEEPRPRVPIGPEGFPRIPPVQTYPQERGTPPVIPVAPMLPYEPMAFNKPHFRPIAHVPAKPRHIPRGRPRSVSPSSTSSEASARSPRSQSRDVIPPPPGPASPGSVRSMSTSEHLIEPSPLPRSPPPPKVPRPSYPSPLPRRGRPPWRSPPSPRSPISQSPPLLKKPTPAESPLPSKLPRPPGSPPPRGSSPPRWPAPRPPSWPQLSTPSPIMITVIPPTPRLDKLGREAKSDAEPLEVTRHPKSCCSSWSGRRRHTL